MAHRLFLTMLALLTGLVAQIGPAEACVSRVGIEAAISGEAPPAPQPRAPVSLARLPVPGLASARRHAPQRVEATPAPAIASVLIGIDRARN